MNYQNPEKIPVGMLDNSSAMDCKNILCSPEIPLNLCPLNCIDQMFDLGIILKVKMLNCRLKYFVVLITLLLPAGIILAQDSTLIRFELKDQFNHVRTEKDFQSKLTILVGSDHDGSKYNDAWGKSIHDSLAGKGAQNRVEFLPVADLRGVPFFLKGFVKGKFPKEPARWILMDWKGQFAQAYNFVPAECNIIVFDGNGQIVHQTSVQEIDPLQLHKILDRIFANLPEEK
jgi:hypothetical protein